jgi:peptidoglycan-associated lipoprotein
MKQNRFVKMLLITVMLSVLGCAQNEAVRKDDGLLIPVPQKSAETGKVAPARPATTAAQATPATDLTARQIAAAGDSADSRKDTLLQTTVAGVVYFGFDSYVLTSESGNILQSHFNKLAGKPSIRIEGHCDEQGSSEYNLALGEKRAKSARNYLVTLGYPVEKISAISYGKERPANSGHDEAAWAKNRRDEIHIVK